MIKNAVIALLAAVIVASADCCAYCWQGMLIGTWTIFFIVTLWIESMYDKLHARMFKRSRLQKRSTDLTKK